MDSINTRPCFQEVFPGTPDYWRRVWMSEVQEIAYKDWKGGIDKIIKCKNVFNK
jgi:hypothetical protein